MAFAMLWRYSWYCAIFLLILEFSLVSSNQDNYYHYELHEHSINRRSPLSEEGMSPSVHPKAQVTEIVPVNVTTPTPVVAVSSSATSSPSRTGGNYVTSDKKEKNQTAPNPEDANRTSQSIDSTTNITSVATPNGAPGLHPGSANDSLIIPVTQSPENSTTGENITAVVQEGISAGNMSSETWEAEEANITINEFSHSVDNETLRDHNITKYMDDHHQYYNSSFIVNDEAVGHRYWVNMTNRSDVILNEMLSQSHRRAATVKLSFDFPFYGHLVRNVTIATGGFLYTGEYVHSWLAATQYIAPLMANFDTSISKNSSVKYVDNGTSFTVQWEKVLLQDKPESGDFTFQATLHNNGDIVFVYQNVPIVIENIQDDHHPVKVGLSDAYIIDRTIFFVRRKTIYEYHRVNFNRHDIKNWTVIVLHALPTCVDLKDCDSCLSMSTTFLCQWCPVANRCSTGTDRNRQDWLHRGCDKSALKNVSQCPAPLNVTHTSQASRDGPPNSIVEGETNSAAQTDHIHSGDGSTGEQSLMADRRVSMGISGVIGILFIIALVAGLGVWALYAYRNPHTASGQFLIRYRPSQWSWKRGEARYTAATIHM
ncbi:plexin domain-containing protein 2 isoform X1 [Periplaneta americana]|uniref:plexin domain-containing protein 2 isoform X1 n=1 Tax=Periplaneta americana TaxID=6978 RepID=UPI0037E7554F